MGIRLRAKFGGVTELTLITQWGLNAAINATSEIFP
jgi:hypothetical protein